MDTLTALNDALPFIAGLSFIERMCELAEDALQLKQFNMAWGYYMSASGGIAVLGMYQSFNEPQVATVRERAATILTRIISEERSNVK